MLTPDQTSQLDSIVQKMAAQNAPASDVQAVVSDFKAKYDKPPTQIQTPQAPTTTTNSGGILSGIGNFVKGLFTPTIPGVTQVGVGAAKSIGDTAVGTYNLGAKIGSKIAQPLGLQPVPQIQSPDILKATSPEQQLGKTIGDVAQYFAPMGAEEKVATSLDKLVDTAKFAEKFGPKAGETLNGILKVIGHGITTGASTAGVQAVQSGGDVSKTESAGTLGFLAGGAGKALEIVAPGIVKSLQKADFKLSGAQSAKASQAAEDAAKFMTDNKILGSPETKYNKLTRLNQSLESTLQAAVPDVNVSKADLASKIEQNVEVIRTQNPAEYASAKADANEAIKTLGGKLGKDGKYTFEGGDTINAKDTLTGKRSWGQRAFKTTKYSVKDPRVSSEGSYAVELAYEEAFSGALDKTGGKISIPSKLQSYFGGQSEVGIKEFNKVYSDAIKAKNLTFLGQNKLDTGLVGRMFGLYAGRALGMAVAPGLGPELVGATLGELASTHIPGMARTGLEYGLSAPASTLPIATRAGLGLSQDNTQISQQDTSSP